MEIESGILEIRNTKILRIITKWCEELESCFDSEKIFNWVEPFKMMDGCEEFYRSDQLEILEELLNEEKVKIDELKKEIV